MTIKDCVNSAIKSFELEGFIYTAEEKDVLNKVASGETSIEEGKTIFMQELTKKYGTKF